MTAHRSATQRPAGLSEHGSDRPSGCPTAPIIVAENAGLLRDGLVGLLSGWSDGPVRPAATLMAAQALLDGMTDAVLLLDAELPGLDGMPGLRSLLGRSPSVRIIVLTDRESRDATLACLAAGAHGTIARAASFAELAQAIQTVRHGSVHVPPGLLAADAVPTVAPAVLTGRQRDVLRLLAEGRSTKDIARTLDLAVSTIKVHLAALYRSVGARNRVEALCRAGVLPPFSQPA